mmetsp:Transcript_1400/g.1918  ORF Transcript_1400/g.1918 Transcript_1400/m.1918 type:complete len:194 (-) Transcript_1400:125-706(-)
MTGVEEATAELQTADEPKKEATATEEDEKKLSDEEAAKAAKRKEIEAKVKAAQEARQKALDAEAAAEMKKKEIEEKGQGYFGNHPGITCDGCGAVPLFGYRYHCKQCANHDICETCYDAWMGGKGVVTNGLHKQTISLSAADHTFNLYKDKGFKCLAKSGGSEPTEKVAPKLKPNEICSCGSGQKYKKCCMNK